jgi:hypothetical protein
MPDVVSVDALFQGTLKTIRMTPGDAPKASIIDFVMAVTGQTNDNAGKTIRRLIELSEIGRTFSSTLEKFQFPGPGQRGQYVLSASQCMELAMILPHNTAKIFRCYTASIVTRVFAGDPTLHDVIKKNDLSNDTIHQFARLDVQRAIGDETIRMTPGATPKASIMDFVMAVTGQTNDNAGKTIRKLQITYDFVGKCERFQFPGIGQREQYVLDAREAIHLLMILPGRSARMFRVECVQLLTQLFAGDPALHALLEENHLLGDATQSFCNYLDAAAPAIMAAAALEDKEDPHTICKEWMHDNLKRISFAASMCPTCSDCTPRDVSFAQATSTMEQIIPGTNYRADILVQLANKDYAAVEVAHTHLTSRKRAFECDEAGIETYEVQTSIVQDAMASTADIHVLLTTNTKIRKCIACAST